LSFFVAEMSREADGDGSVSGEEEQNLQEVERPEEEGNEEEDDDQAEIELGEEDSEEDESDDPHKPTLKNLYAGNFVSHFNSFLSCSSLTCSEFR
jgi:hypothetical protein